ncbi:hypothetical protein N7507_011190 [Penicillium longicatenatum]|nr:hypothetical protein N7507_011190 [Penicillium longicatenatum]
MCQQTRDAIIILPPVNCVIVTCVAQSVRTSELFDSIAINKLLPLEISDTARIVSQFVLKGSGEAFKLLFVRGPIENVPDDIDKISPAIDILALSLRSVRGDDCRLGRDGCCGAVLVLDGFGGNEFNVQIRESGNGSRFINLLARKDRGCSLDMWEGCPLNKIVLFTLAITTFVIVVGVQVTANLRLGRSVGHMNQTGGWECFQISALGSVGWKREADRAELGVVFGAEVTLGVVFGAEVTLGVVFGREVKLAVEGTWEKLVIGKVLISLQSLSVGFMIRWDKVCLAVVDWQLHREALLPTISRLHMADFDAERGVELEPEEPLAAVAAVAAAPATDRMPDVS